MILIVTDFGWSTYLLGYRYGARQYTQVPGATFLNEKVRGVCPFMSLQAEIVVHS